MRKLGFSRLTTLILAILGGLMLLACLGAAAFLITGSSLINGRSPTSAPITWTQLPRPVVANPEWINYSYTGQINALAQRDNLLWIATGGGVVALDLRTGETVKFTSSHGMASNRVSSVAVGPNGIVWAGTNSGVSRYDGATWQTFTTSDGLGDDEVTALLIDPQNHVWAATPAGLSRFDGRRWQTYSSDDFLSAMPSDTIRDLAPGPDGQIWAATDQGLGLFNGRSWESITTADGLNSDDILALAIAPNGDLWAATPVGLNRLRHGEWETFSDPTLAAAVIQTLAVGIDNTLWIGPGAGNNDLLHFDGQTFNAVPLPLEATGGVEALLLDGKEQLWVGTANALFRTDDQSWLSIPTPSELPSNNIHALLESNGELWLATEAGVSQFGANWTHYTPQDGLANQETRALALDRSGQIWAAHGNPALGFSVRTPAGNWQTHMCNLNAPPSQNVNAGAMAPDNSLWFATDNGVAHFDGEQWKHFTTTNDLPANKILDLEISAAGEIWVTTPAGVAVFDGATWETVSRDAADKLALGPENVVWAILEQSVARLENGRLQPYPIPGNTVARDLTATAEGVWIATPDGVALFDGGRWQFFTTEDGLPGNDVTAVAQDSNGVVWAAGSGNAQEINFVFYDGKQWRPHPDYDAASEKLLNNQIVALQPAPDGALWLASPRGLQQVAGDVWRNFSSAAGLAGNNVRALAFAQEALWALTEAGLGRYDGQQWQSLSGTHGDALNALERLLAAPNGDLWVHSGNFSAGLFVFDGAAWQTVPTLTGFSRLDAWTFDGNGRLWAAGERLDRPDFFLGYYDPAKKEWVWQLPGTQNFPVSTLAFDDDGFLWIGAANGQGVFVRDVSGGGTGEIVAEFPQIRQPTVMTTTRDGVFWIANEDRFYAWDGSGITEMEVPLSFLRHIFALAEDADGRLWVGSEQGAARYKDGVWETFYAPAQAPAWWGSVATMQVRPDGGILLGTAVGGIGLYTGRAFLGDRPEAWRGQSIPVNTIFNDNETNLWVGTGGGGAARFDGVRWSIFTPEPALTAPVTGLGFSGDGRSWLGTQAGIVPFSGLGSESCRFEPGIKETVVFTMQPDRNGRLWAGTDNLGAAPLGDADADALWEGSTVRVLALAPDNDMWFVNPRHDWLLYMDGQTVKRTPLNTEFVTAQAINTMDVAADLTVWLGTPDGVVTFNGRDWSAITTTQGLADNEIDHLLISADGGIWIATPGGLSRKRP